MLIKKLHKYFLHQQIDLLVHFKVVQIVGISLQPHQQSTKGNVGCPETKMTLIIQKNIYLKMVIRKKAEEDSKLTLYQSRVIR